MTVYVCVHMPRECVCERKDVHAYCSKMLAAPQKQDYALAELWGGGTLQGGESKSQQKSGSAAPSSKWRAESFLLAPRRQWLVARRIDSESCVLTKFIVVLYGLVHLSARRAANHLTKCSPSRCRTPSVVTTKGVKSARRSQQASWCLFFFALARLSRTAVTWRLTYDWASALQTRKSNNASVCGCHTPRTARSHTRPLPSPCSRDSRTTGSRVTCAYAMEAS